MKSNPQLLAALASLTAGLDDPSVDLHRSVTELVAALTQSVDSLVSVALTVVVDQRPYSVTVPVHSGQDAVSSVAIPLRPRTGAAAGSQLVLLAGTRGAFVDLVADVSSAMNWDTATIAIDTHVPVHSASTGDHTFDIQQDLEDRSTIDQALGVLLAQGLTMHDAGRHLTHRAEQDGVTIADAARAVLHDAVNVHRPEP